MSQVVKRKSAVSDEKEKKTDSPVKDMKKKVAANAEKDKQAVEKAAEKQPDKTEKPKQAEKPTEKSDKQKQPEKPTEKNEKQKQSEKAAEKEKPADKSTDKKVDKNGVENKKTDNKEKNAQEKKDDKADKNAKADAKKNGDKPKQNGSKHNGVENNGVEEAASDDDVLEIADDEFPELAYDDTSDNESPTPDSAPSRSATRRSQVKATRTPETPQPAADKPAESSGSELVKAARTPETPQHAADKPAVSAGAELPKDSKVLKLSEVPPTDRKLRSDDPKPEKQDKDGKKDAEKEAKAGEDGEQDKDEIIEIDADEEPRKTDTNYSKSRVKVSPYRRSTRLADQTASSMTANYTGSGSAEPPPSASGHPQLPQDEQLLKTAQVVLTPIAKVPPYVSAWLDQSASSDVATYSGNNTTMEMDITETSSFAEDASLDDSSYLSGLRTIRGRRSYKPLKELSLKHANRSARSTANTSLSECRPTGTVVGRKRKPEAEAEAEAEGGAEAAADAGELAALHTKRMRLLERIAQPFRRTLAHTPLPARRNPEIVGINTDLPLTAPVAAPSSFDPESLKAAPAHAAHAAPPPAHDDMDKKRCVVM